MRKDVRTLGMLLLGGFGCLGVGVLIGDALRSAPQPVWRRAAAPAPGATTSLPSFRDVVAGVEDSVVSVRATLPAAAPPATGPTPEDAAVPAHEPTPGRRNGSGFVVHERGLVVTSRHVVVGCDEVEVWLPRFGRRRADLIGQDPATDLALLRLESPPPGLVALPMGDSDELRAGDWIVAVGNPYGFSRTVTAGLVSFVGRHLRHSDLGVSHDFLQISAPINPGNSGGPVFDVHGRVVGVINQVATRAQGISFAVPSRAVEWALEEMRRRPDGMVRRGYLGIEFAARAGVDAAGRPMPGAVIVDVMAGQPAERAGLRRGDVVLGVDGEPILAPEQLHERIVQSPPGTAIALQLLRDERVCDPIVAVLGEVGRRPGAGTTN